MSTQYPQIAGYTGTFSGSPVSINIQADHGWVAQQVVATGTADMTLSFPTGNALSIPAGIALVFGGPVNEMTLTGTVGQKYTVYASAVAGTFSVTGSSSGGGGGGAPTTAPYLLDGASVDPALTNGVAVGALDHTLDVVRVVGSSAGAATPIKLVTSNASAPAAVGGGVAIPLRWKSNAGEQTVAILAGSWIDVSNPADPKGALTVTLGAAETLAMLVKVGEIDLPGDNTVKASGDLTLTGQGATDLVLSTYGSALTNTNNVDDDVAVVQITQSNPAATYATKTTQVFLQTDPHTATVRETAFVTAQWDTNNPLAAGAGRLRISTKNGPYGVGNQTGAYFGWNDDEWGLIFDGTNYGAGSAVVRAQNGSLSLSSSTANVDVVANGGKVSFYSSTGAIDCNSAEILNINDGAHTGSAAACGQFLTGVATVLAGQNTVTVAVNAKFNGKSVRCGLSGIPGGAIAATPVLFSGTVAAGTLTISVVDVTTGALLAGGVTTNTDVTYDSFAF